jgi:hypothetical protein
MRDSCRTSASNAVATRDANALQGHKKAERIRAGLYRISGNHYVGRLSVLIAEGFSYPTKVEK